MENNQEILLQAFSRVWQVGKEVEGEGCKTLAKKKKKNKTQRTVGNCINAKDVISQPKWSVISCLCCGNTCIFIFTCGWLREVGERGFTHGMLVLDMILSGLTKLKCSKHLVADGC